MDIPKTKRVADLTVEELLSLWEDQMRGLIHEAIVTETERQAANRTVNHKRSPLVLPTVDVGPWPEGLSLRREDMYGDDGR